MDCKEIKELLFDYAAGRLSSGLRVHVEEHISTCETCKTELTELKKTLPLLDDLDTPDISPAFKRSVMDEIERREEEKSKSLLDKLTDKIFKPFHIKIPIQAVAIVLIAFISITIYKDYIKDKEDQQIRDIPVINNVQDAKNPITIQVENIDEAFQEISNILEENNWKLIRRIKSEDSLKLTVNVEIDKEELFLSKLIDIGNVNISKDEYKDGEGNIVLLIEQ